MDNSAGIKSVGLALDILELVGEAGGEIGVSALARKLNVTKPTVFRHLQTLTNRGYLAKNAVTSKYSLGRSATALLPQTVSAIDLLSIAIDDMRSLAATAGQTVVLSSVSPSEVTVLHTELGRAPLEIGVRVGSRLPLHASAQGKIALAYCPQLLGEVNVHDLATFTPHTIVAEPDLMLELERARRQGWISAPEEMTLGVNSIAVPILDAAGQCAGTLAVVGSIQFIGRNVDEVLCRQIMSAAENISDRVRALPVAHEAGAR